MLSQKKHTEISLICYANVSTQFAIFCNSRNRGANFEWANFTTMMAEQAVDWMFIHGVKGDKKKVNETAKKYAREIAERMISLSGF